MLWCAALCESLRLFKKPSSHYSISFVRSWLKSEAFERLRQSLRLRRTEGFIKKTPYSISKGNGRSVFLKNSRRFFERKKKPRRFWKRSSKRIDEKKEIIKHSKCRLSLKFMSILKQGLRIKQKALASILKSLIINIFAFASSSLREGPETWIAQ